MTQHQAATEAKQILIHIDKAEFHVHKDVMTGSELRNLPIPPIGPDRDLYLEVPGPDPDRLIGNDDAVTLKSGMDFYTAPSRITPGARHSS